MFKFLIIFIFSLNALSMISFEDYLFKTKNINTDYILIYKNGKKLFQKYNRGYKRDQKHLSWSMAKTVTGILIAQAIEQGLLTLNERVSKTFPKFKGQATIKDLLQMSSGIDFTEKYSGLPVSANVTRMLYINGPQSGFANYTLSLPLINNLNPGEYFYYSSGDTNILMAILKSKLATNEYNNFPWKNLFDPLKISATFEQDSQGVFVGSSYLYMSANDYLKIAKLFLNDGKYEDKQILPKWYLKNITKLAKGVNLKAKRGTSPRKAYSIQTSINSPILGRKLPPEFKYLPSDSILFLGFQNQIIVVSPREKLIIIRLARDKGKTFKRDLFFKKAYEQFYPDKLKIALNEYSNLYANYKKPQELPPKNTTMLSDYLLLTKLLKNSASKEYCSCILVEKRTSKQCEIDLRSFLPFIPHLNISNKEITADFYIDKSSTSRFINDKLGCYLTYQ